MASIFPQVTVTIVRPLQAGTKQIQTMPVGLIGPQFKRITETKTNGYAVIPETAESVSMNLTGTTDNDYIDYNSVEVQLAVAGSDEVVALNPSDKEVIPANQTVQSNLYIGASTTGFYKKMGTTESIFYPTTGKNTSYAAVPGDFLYLKKTGVTMLHKIKQVRPELLSASNTPSPDTFVTDTFAWSDGIYLDGVVTEDASPLMPDHMYLILEDKTDSSNILQYRISTVVNSGNSGAEIVIVLNGAMTSGDIQTDDGTEIGNLSNWNFYVYDMPLGSIMTYNTTVYTSDEYVTGDTLTYKVLDKHFSVTTQGASNGRYGSFVKTTTANEYIFLPDKRATVDYFGANPGDYLRARHLTTDQTVDFRITDKDSTVLASDVLIKNFTVRLATTSTDGDGSGNIATLGSFNSTIDGTALVAGDLVLVKNQSTASQNGIYIFGAPGLTRYTGFDAVSATEVHYGAAISVTSGSTLSGNIYTLNYAASYTLGVTSLAFTLAAGTFEIATALTSEDVIANKCFLVGVNKLDNLQTRVYNVTAYNTTNSKLNLVVTNLNFSSDGAGANNAIILDDYTDWTWSVYRTPPNSLLLSNQTVGVDSNFAIVTGSATGSHNITAWDFSIVNKADYHMTGKTELTILNHIADSAGDEIGLADVVVSYNVLNTEYAGQMWDIVNQEDRDLVCGLIASYNPIGLASGLVEINTRAAYKVIPCDIAFSERDPDNPKSYIGEFVMGGENTNYHDVTKLDWITAYEVLDSVKDTQIPYYIVPLTQDESVTGLSSTTVEALANPKKMKEMVTFISTPLIDYTNVVTNINQNVSDFIISSDNKIRFKPSSVYVDNLEPIRTIDFLGLGIRKGDYLVGKVADTEGVEELKYKINNIYPEYLDLGTTELTLPADVLAQFDTDYKFEIRRIYNTKAELASSLSKKASGYNSFRTKLIWGDLCDFQIEGSKFVSYPSFYAAVAYAAMANQVGVVLPKTNRTLVGITKVYNVSPKFTTDNLETIGEGFMDILGQDYENGPVFSKRQFMTDGSELSGVEVVDELAKYMRILFRPYLGKYNIDVPLFDVLSIVLSSIISTYVPNKLNGLAIIKGFTITGANSDRLSLIVRPDTKKPFNGLDIEIQVA